MKFKDNYENYLKHYGVKGMKWGVRRYQNEDGSLTALGKERYYNSKESKRLSEYVYRDTKLGYKPGEGTLVTKIRNKKMADLADEIKEVQEAREFIEKQASVFNEDIEPYFKYMDDQVYKDTVKYIRWNYDKVLKNYMDNIGGIDPDDTPRGIAEGLVFQEGPDVAMNSPQYKKVRAEADTIYNNVDIIVRNMSGRSFDSTDYTPVEKMIHDKIKPGNINTFDLWAIKPSKVDYWFDDTGNNKGLTAAINEVESIIKSKE